MWFPTTQERDYPITSLASLLLITREHLPFQPKPSKSFTWETHSSAMPFAGVTSHQLEGVCTPCCMPLGRSTNKISSHLQRHLFTPTMHFRTTPSPSPSLIHFISVVVYDFSSIWNIVTVWSGCQLPYCLMRKLRLRRGQHLAPKSPALPAAELLLMPSYEDPFYQAGPRCQRDALEEPGSKEKNLIASQYVVCLRILSLNETPTSPNTLYHTGLAKKFVLLVNTLFNEVLGETEKCVYLKPNKLSGQPNIYSHQPSTLSVFFYLHAPEHETSP